MKLLDFLNKYEYNMDVRSSEFKTDWEYLKKYNIFDINFVMEQIVEKRFPSNLIKDLFDFCPSKQTEELKNNLNLFKWAAAFNSKETIDFFHKNLTAIDEDGAINAAIINFRLDNLQALTALGINVFTDKNFCQAIQRSYQPRSSKIIEYYLENKDKFHMTEFSKDLLIKQHDQLVDWTIRDDSLDQVKYLIQEGSQINRGELFEKVCMNGELECVKYLLTNENFQLRMDVPILTEKEISAGFMYAVYNEHIHIAEYLVFEQNIKQTRYISAKIKDRPEITSLFRARNLTTNLVIKDSNEKSLKKIKI